MGVVFDEVVADVSEPARRPAEEIDDSEQSEQTHQIKRDVLRCIERKKYREQRLKAD